MAVDIKFKRLNKGAVVPKFAHDGDAGFDFHSTKDYRLSENDITVMDTGLSVEVPYGYELQIRPRSGLAAKCGVTIVNSPGTIDSGYRGEIKIIATLVGNAPPFFVERGARIAQGVIKKLEDINIVEVGDLSGSARGEGGLGSTGK